MNKRNLGILKFLVVLFILVAGSIFWISIRDSGQTQVRISDPKLDLEALRKSGEFLQAYDEAIRALKDDPTNSFFAVEAGELALILRKPNSAGAHMREAWRLGERNLFLLLVIVDSLDGPTSEKVEQFEILFAELPQTPDHLNAKAKFYSRAGRNDEALEIWIELCDANPSEEVILQIARKLEVIGRREEAILHLQQYAGEALLTAKGYNLLASLLVFDNQLDEAAQVIRSIEPKDLYGEWALKKAMFSLVEGDVPGAALILNPLTQASVDHPIAYIVSHEARICLALLRVILEGSAVRLDDLSVLANQEIQFFPTRTATTPLLGLRAGPKQIEAEHLVYSFLKSAQRDECPPNTQFLRMASLLPDSPVIRWLGIRHALLSGRPADAVKRYTEINELHPLERLEGRAGFFYKSPLFLFEAARAFSEDDRPREALTLINHLHERGHYTSESTQLFKQLMNETGRSADVAAMQGALARQFKEDPAIQLASVSLAYDQGDAEGALEILSPLLQTEEHEDLEMVELMLMVSQGKVDEVLRRCDDAKVPEQNKNLIRARAWLQKGDPEKGEEFFKKALNPADGFYGYLDYARFLVEGGRTDEAARLYEDVLESFPDNLVALQGLGIIDEVEGRPDDAIRRFKKILRMFPDDSYSQTRLAKVYLQKEDARSALTTINKVLSRDPKNPDATYLQMVAMIGTAMDQPFQTLSRRKLIEVDQKMNELLTRSPDNPQFFLRIYLATAFREMDQPDHAREIYRELLALDSTVWSRTSLKRQDVELAFEGMNE